MLKNIKFKFIDIILKKRSKLIVQYIDYCLYQSTLDIHNIQSLQYLRFILFLNDNDIKKIILQKKELIHASYLEKKVYDHTLYEHELLQLEKIPKPIIII